MKNRWSHWKNPKIPVPVLHIQIPVLHIHLFFPALTNSIVEATSRSGNNRDGWGIFILFSKNHERN